jgi:hypothetical protein
MAEDQSVIDIPADLDVAAAAAVADRLCAAIEASDRGSVLIALDDARATQPALQLFFAARKEIARRGATVETRLTSETERN